MIDTCGTGRKKSLRRNGLGRTPGEVRPGYACCRSRGRSSLDPIHLAHHHTVGSLFSQISGKFSKTLIFGCFFPVVFFVLLDWILFEPYMPPATGVVKTLRALDEGWQTLAMGGLTVLFSGLLYILNTPIVRFYEGYPWADSLIGQFFTARQQARRKRTLTWWYGLRSLADAMKDNPGAAKAAGRELELLRNHLGRRYNDEFPSQEGSVLPTRLGNVIRCFEDYPRRQYGMSAIPLWPRLIAVIDSSYASSADDAKSSFDFMINVSFLSALSAASLLLLGLTSPVRWSAGLGWSFWIPLAALCVMSWIFYRGSIGRAAEWGNLVRGAFDLYRGKLLEQLGFDYHPAGLREERELWKVISQQMIYGDPPPHKPVPLLRFSDHGTFAYGEPAGVVLEVTRSASPLDDKTWQTAVAVRNTGKVAVDKVRLTDTLASGERYVWNSALSGGTVLPVSGDNPIVIQVGTVAPGQTVIVSYRTAK